MHKITLKKKYISALLLTGAYAVVSYFLSIFLIENNSHYLEDINLLGKERMYTGQILFYTNEVYHHHSYAQVQELKKALADFKEVDTILKSRGYVFEEQNKREFFKLVGSFLTFFENSNEKWEESEGFEIDRLLSVQYKKLIKNIDDYVLKVQKESEEEIKNTLLVKIVLFVLLVFLLIAQAIFIFMPAEKEIKEKTKKLGDINKNLKELVAAEVAKNEEKTLQIIHQSRLATMGEMVSMI
ncbi:MAG: hypothetical protein M0Q20_03125, partial [Sulfurimonas sp.]|nr:hypothetical protein [Sulfurimonas sp.]